MAIQTTASDLHLRSSQAMGLPATSPFSITVWISANWNLGTRTSLVGIYGPTTDVPLGLPVTAIQIGSTNGGGELSCWTWGGTVLVGTGAGVMTAFQNVWVHVVYTFDGLTHRVYLNGVEQTNSTTAQIPGFLNQAYINGFPGGTTSEVAAYQTDQYSLYRRTLSASEVLTIFNSAGSRNGIVNGLIARYEFDEGVQGGTVIAVPDFSGNGNTLTPDGTGTAFTYTYSNTRANSNIRPVQ